MDRKCDITWLEVPNAIAYAKAFVGDDYDEYGMIVDFIEDEIDRLERIGSKRAARLINIIYWGENRMANYVRALCELTGHTTALVLVDSEDIGESAIFLGYSKEAMREITKTIRRYMAAIRAALRRVADDEAGYKDEMLDCLYLVGDDVDVNKCLEKARLIREAEAAREGSEQ